MKKKIISILLLLVTIGICAGVYKSQVDSAPVAATLPSAGTASLNVVDISQWNDALNSNTDNINFALLKTQVDAIYIRAYGYNKDTAVVYQDIQAANFATSAQNNGIAFGFYYYFVPTNDLESAKQQARDFYTLTTKYAYTCVPVLDIEVNPNGLTTAQIMASTKAFADTFKSLSSYDVMIYSYPDFMNTNFSLDQNWSTYKLWIAHYGVTAPLAGISSWYPVSKCNWERWDMWQYTSTGVLSSIPTSASGKLDMSHATANIFVKTPTALGNLEYPSSTTEDTGDITIQGWALSHSGVSRIDIYADNFEWVGSTTTYARADVQAIMNPDGIYYQGLYSGFSYSVDASRFTAGTHTLEIAVINKNGTVDWRLYTFTVGPASQICVDSPSDSIESTGDVTVSGWAINHAGVSRVDFYLDNFTWLGSSSMSTRSDVNAALNSSGTYRDALHSGFSYTIAAEKLTPGDHTVYIAAIGKDGSVQWAVKTIHVGPASQGCIDSPSANATATGDVTVSGWALSHAGISRVDVYLDNNIWIGSTSDLYARADVNAARNPDGTYKNGLNSGFSYTIDSSKLTPGVHTIRVAAISKDGSVQWLTTTINVINSQTCIDAPGTDTLYGDVTVSGWSISHAGISRVDFYVDNFTWAGSTSAIYNRADVAAVYNASGAYPNSLKSGFSYTIDADLLSEGTHTIYIAAISKDGSVQWSTRVIHVGPKAQMCIDSPGEGTTQSSFTVSGWAVSLSGLSRVDVYADGNVYIGSNSSIISRSDVNAIINSKGQYANATQSGFSIAIPAGTLTPGKHAISIAAISNDGTVQWTVRTITVK